MTTPPPEAVAAAVERLKRGKILQDALCDNGGKDCLQIRQDIETILAALAAQTEELANHYHDFKRIRQLMMCDGSDFEQLESKWNSVQAELAQARKDVERLEWLDKSKLLLGTSLRAHIDAAMQQEQKP